jgi:integrase
MAAVFRQQYTKSGPDGDRVSKLTRKWYIEYVDANGVTQRVPGYADKGATLQLAAQLERQAAQGKVGALDPFLEWRAQTVAGALADYRAYLKAKKNSTRWVKDSLSRLRRAFAATEVRVLGDLTAAGGSRFGKRFQDYLQELLALGKSHRTRNVTLENVRAFLNWAKKAKRIERDLDPLELIERLDEVDNQPHPRRASTHEEVLRLTDAAQRRPLERARALRVRAGVSPEEEARLTLLGQQRALIYKTLFFTALRRVELARVRVGDLDLDEDDITPGSVRVAQKSRRHGRPKRVAKVPLRADLKLELRAWLAVQPEKGPTDPLFAVPQQLVKVLKRDLEFAGIPYRDELGRFADEHALRKTTSTQLSRNNVPPRVTQQALRHSRLELTMSTYTDPELLDVAESMESLPALPAILDKPEETQTGEAGAQGEQRAYRRAYRRGSRSNGANCSCVHSEEAPEVPPDGPDLRNESSPGRLQPGLGRLDNTGHEPVTSCMYGGIPPTAGGRKGTERLRPAVAGS